MPTADNSYFTLIKRLNDRTLANGYFPKGIAIDESIQLSRDVGNTTFVIQYASIKKPELPCSCYNLILKTASQQGQTSSTATAIAGIPGFPPINNTPSGRNNTAGNISQGGPTNVGVTP